MTDESAEGGDNVREDLTESIYFVQKVLGFKQGTEKIRFSFKKRLQCGE
jgi:hypothetical protein